MIKLRIPSDHPNHGVISRWAQDKEQIIDKQGVELKRLQGIIKTVLTNNPSLGKV